LNHDGPITLKQQTLPAVTLKWDKTGVIIEVRQCDQYGVNVDGSGRVTLRNRICTRQEPQNNKDYTGLPLV
jgi:hypothetical protein